VQNLSSLQYDLVNLLDAEWSTDKYTYIKRGEKK